MGGFLDFERIPLAVLQDNAEGRAGWPLRDSLVQRALSFHILSLKYKRKITYTILQKNERQM